MAKNDDKIEEDKLKVKSWSEFSMNEQSEVSIRNRILLEGVDSVCVSYICRYSRLSERFIDELRVLSTGLLEPDIYYSRNLEIISNALDKRSDMRADNPYKKLDGEKLGKIKLLYEDPDGTTYTMERAVSGIRDRLDWVYLSQYQVLSEEFILKHAKEVHWGFIFKSQNVSAAFKKKYGHFVSLTEAPIESEV